jgi:hypothetical protein
MCSGCTFVEQKATNFVVAINNMVQAYNFLASWQLFPEKGIYELGERPKSGIYKISSEENSYTLKVENQWVNLENKAFQFAYRVDAHSGTRVFEDAPFADHSEVIFPNSISLEIHFFRGDENVLQLTHEILPNGYLSLTQKGINSEGKYYTNKEVYHKQMSVLPYASSVSGAVIKPTEEGVIRHKALTAMEEQTNMQLEQIRKQIELLALQAQEIQQRKELSLMIYDARLNFAPVIGQTYFLYERADESYLLSMVSPEEWGGGAGPFKRFIAAVRLLADHTWMEVR